MKKILCFLLFLKSFSMLSQELNAIVSINTQQVNITNKNVFKTLEKSLTEFINQTRWTNLKVADSERINCNFTLIVTSYQNNQISGNLLVQSSRPVFNTSYQSPTLNLQDNELSFNYQEFETLSFSENNFESNLTSVVAYYCYIILGFDANSFGLNAGIPYFQKAQNIVTQAQSSSFSGWTDTGKNNRWSLLTDLLSDSYENYHKAWYEYHRLGLDTMIVSENQAKQAIEKSILLLENISSLRLNSYPMNLFFNAKADEISAIFSGGSIYNTSNLKNSLQKLAPSQLTKWNAIK